MKLHFSISDETSPRKALIVCDEKTQNVMRRILIDKRKFEFASFSDITYLSLEGHTIVIVP